jgi:hypothetical protein
MVKLIFCLIDKHVLKKGIWQQSHLFGFTLTFFIPAPAYAYLDPGAGASIIALLAGGFTGILVLFQMFRNKIGSFFKKDKDKEDQ